jgi:hypothetical protein
MKGISATVLFTIGGLTHRLRVVPDRYAIGAGLAVQLFEEDDECPFAVASINVEGVALAEDEFVCKTYSENEGLLEAMLLSGVVECTGRSVDQGPVCRLLHVAAYDVPAPFFTPRVRSGFPWSDRPGAECLEEVLWEDERVRLFRENAHGWVKYGTELCRKDPVTGVWTRVSAVSGMDEDEARRRYAKEKLSLTDAGGGWPQF